MLCNIPDCNKTCRIHKTLKDGTKRYKKRCSFHLINNKPPPVVVEEKKPVKVKYHRFKKMFCENQDGRLGFVCNYEIKILSQLELDHIDGNPYNNVNNHQTLCCNCHKFKTITNKDHLSPGKKRTK